MSKILVNNIELDYVDVGTGNKTIVLLHGLGSTKQDWDKQIPCFSKHFRVIAVDLRGHGKSTIPKTDYGVAFMAEDIHQLLESLNINIVTPIGFSMGGAVAFEFAVTHPEKVDKLVIVNSGPDFNNMGKIGEDLLNNRTAFLKTKGIKALAKEVAFNMLPEPHQKEERKKFEERCAANSYNSYYNSFVTLMDWGLGNKLETINKKTLIIASEMDYTPISFKEDYAKKIKKAQVKVVHNSRHGVVIDQPQAFNKIVLDFLKNE